MKNYSELVLPGLLTKVEPNRVIEMLDRVAGGDANNTIRLALYINGTINKRDKFAPELDAELASKLRLCTDDDYRGRKVRFESYSFIDDRVYFTRFGGDVRHAFKTQEEADAWVETGKTTTSWGWRRSDTYPYEVWRPAEDSRDCSCDADTWPEE